MQGSYGGVSLEDAVGDLETQQPATQQEQGYDYGDYGGVSLEEAFEAGKPDSKRKTGIVLVMEIKYDNVQTSSTSIIEYKTYVTEVKGANFKSEQGLFNSNPPDQRMVYNRHGIRVLILQTGDLGHFEFVKKRHLLQVRVWLCGV